MAKRKAKRRSPARAKKKAPARAKKAAKMSCSCGPWAWVWLVLGLALLLRDLGMFNLLGNASWASLVITLLGIEWVAK